MGSGNFIAAIAAGCFGAIFVSVASFYFQHGTNFCDPDNATCAREWLIALATLAAAVGAIAAVIISVRTLAAQNVSSEKQLRAYLAPVGAELREVFTAVPFLRLSFQNLGQTPAHRVNLTWKAHVQDARFLGPTAGPYFVQTFGYVGPQALRHFDGFLDREVLASLQAHMDEKNMRVFVDVTLDYIDEFGRHRKTAHRFKTFENKPFGDGELAIAAEGAWAD